MSIDPSEWRGLVAGKRRSPTDYVRVNALLEQSRTGVSGAFKTLGSDSKVWWVKPPGHDRLKKTLVTEYVVASVGRVIGAPTCNNTLIWIPEELASGCRRGNVSLTAGFGHATLHVADALEERQRLNYRSDDDNRRRHAGVYALHDWCYGSDQQWLYSTSNSMTIFSHDHGWYLPPGGPDWTVDSLHSMVDRPNPLEQETAGLDPDAVSEMAQRLESVQRSTLADILTVVPATWRVSDEELETLGWFLERRALSVAERIKSLL